MQRAEHGQAHLPGDRLHHAIGGQPRPDDRVDAGRQRFRRRVVGKSGPTGPGPGTGPGSMNMNAGTVIGSAAAKPAANKS